jgi:CheY-like chemotaxis protein
MNQLIGTANQFSFQGRELSQQLLDRIHNGNVGYWEHQFDGLAATAQMVPWHLAIANSQILYSGNRLWSLQSLMSVIYRYTSHTRNELVKLRLEQLENQAQKQALNPALLIAEMKKIGIINDAQLIKALKTRILNDLDTYLSIGSGNAKFIADPELVNLLPLKGFNPAILLDEAKQRQSIWEKIQPQVPSMNLIPLLNPQAIAKANLPTGQQQRIENLVKSRQSLNEIAEEMAKDTLEIAEMFAKLARVGLITLQSPKKNTPSPIMVVDDSPTILVQFQHWIEGWGYPVVVCQQPEAALARIVEVEPAAIFIDLNMPGLSGFELVKQIRKQPQLASIPLVILTGEQKLSNRWRAQWSGCDFLTKPLASSDVSDFQVRLEELLLKLVGAAGTGVQKSTNNYSLN